MRPGSWVLVGALLAGAAGCGHGVPVPFTLSSDPDQAPFTGASELALVVEQRGVVVQETLFAIDATEGRLPLVPEGTGYVLRAEARANGVVLSRGRSFPFDLLLGVPAPAPDVFVGTLGLFARSSDDPPPTGAILAISPTSRGALWISDDGSLQEYVAHDGARASGRDATIRPVATVADAAAFSWVAMAGGRLLAVGGPADEARLYDATGAAIAKIVAPSGTRLDRGGAALVAVGGGTAALLLGGVPRGSVVESDVATRVDVIEQPGRVDLALTDLPPLPTPSTDATAVPIEVRGGAACPCERVLLFGGSATGTPLMEATLVDPAGVAASVSAPLSIPTVGASLAPLGTGLVAVAGGLGAGGLPSAQVQILAVSAAQIDVLSPAPPPLFEARTSAAATAITDGLVLVYGGVDAVGAPLATAELLEFPGDVAPTGALPAAMPAPRGVLLADDSVLVVDAGVQAIFIVPRSL